MTQYLKLLRALSEAGVEFILIGGAAATAHGSSRLTDDLDILYRRSPNTIAALVSSLAPFGPYLRGAPAGLPFSWDEETIARGLNFTLNTSLGPIDVFGEITGGGRFEDLMKNTIELDLEGVRCLCLDLKSLIRVKRAAGRPKDLQVAAELESILNETDHP